MKKNEKMISIIIPAYNSEKYISKCLNSLINQKGNFEIIVVDSSKDKTQEIIINQFPSVRLIHLDEQTYAGKARNIGVKNAKGNIIGFIDSDCIATENWICDALKMMDNYDFVGGSVKNANPSYISNVDFILQFGEFMPYMKKKEVRLPLTYNFVCKKELFIDVGGFPEDILASEEPIFGYHAINKGYKLYFDPKLVVSHNNRGTLKDFISHVNNLSKYSAKVKKEYKLHGNILFKCPPIILLVPFIRLTKISLRILKNDIKSFPYFIICIPLVLFGLILWLKEYLRVAINA